MTYYIQNFVTYLAFIMPKCYNISGYDKEVIKMAMTRQTSKNDCIIFSTLEDLVPKDHLVRKIEESIDLTFIENKVEHLYSSIGRPSIPPKVLFKLLIINFMFGINSMRRTCEECKVNLAYRWYLGLSMDDDIPNYSTWSQNYIRRYHDSEIFSEIFEEILKQANEYGFLDLSTVYGDGTHQKACANKNKYEDKEVEIISKSYDEQLLKEINEERAKIGKKPFKTIEKTEIVFDEKTGEEKEVKKTKHIKQSITDPESGNYHKGEKEKCFAYTHQAFSDNNGFVVECSTNAGNMHDSSAFDEVYDKLIEKHNEEIENVCLDAGYNTPAICKKIIDDGKTPLMPYSRPKGKKGLIKKKEYEYNKDEDCYVCPNGCILTISTINREGYKIYKSNKEECSVCPLRDTCTKSKSGQKVITRHIWQDNKDQVNDNRFTDNFKENYPHRKETVERIFGDCKEQHGLRYTRVRGLEKNSNQALLIFACHNLKKMGLWRWKYTHNIVENSNILVSIYNFCIKKVICFCKHTTLSTV